MKRSSILGHPIKSSFLSCEKDAETIIKQLFVSSQPYSNELKRLLIINTKNCLDESNQNYQKIVENTSVKDLIEGENITLIPKVKLKDHEEVKSHIILSFDEFYSTDNPEYRDCIISFDVFCHTDYWQLDNYQLRPFKILGIIDGILNECKLSGIGTLKFFKCEEIILNDDISGYSLYYRATHGNDDKIEG